MVGSRRRVGSMRFRYMDVFDSSQVALCSSDHGVESLSDGFVFHVNSVSLHNSEELVDHGMRVGSSMSDDGV